MNDMNEGASLPKFGGQLNDSFSSLCGQQRTDRKPPHLSRSRLWVHGLVGNGHQPNILWVRDSSVEYVEITFPLSRGCARSINFLVDSLQ